MLIRLPGGQTMARNSYARADFEEALEPRRLLAFTHVGADGTLFLDGTAGDDQMTVAFQHTGVGLILNGQTELFDNLPPRIHVIGGDGNDTIDATLSPISINIEGDSGDDSIHGSIFADTLYGWEGNDTIVADGGKDLVRGGDGNDRLTGDGGTNDLLVGNDTIFGDAGDDIIDAGAGNDVARGGDGADSVAGAAGNDTLIGDAQNDTLDGGIGRDRFYGGAGDDTVLSRDRLRDTIDGGAGSNDTASSDKIDRLLVR
jgi:Ca2+-binding RTX toxin-like protein